MTIPIETGGQRGNPLMRPESLIGPSSVEFLRLQKKEKNLATALTSIRQIAIDHFRANPSLWGNITPDVSDKPKGERVSIATKRAAALIERRDFSRLKPHTPEREALTELERRRLQFERDLTRKVIDANRNFELSDAEVIIALQSLDDNMAEAFNDLYLQSQKAINNQPGDTGRLLEERIKEKTNGLIVPIYVIGQTGEDEHTKLVTYADAFREPIARIETGVNKILSGLRNLPRNRETDAFINFYETFLAAHTSRNIDEQITLFLELNIRLRAIEKLVSGKRKGVKLIPTFNIEGEGPQAIPEYDLSAVDSRAEAADLNIEMEEMIGPLISEINRVYKDYAGDGKEYLSIHDPLIKACEELMRTGRGLNFVTTGRFRPDDPKLRAEHGLGALIYLELIIKQMQAEGGSLSLLRGVFGENIQIENSPLIDLNDRKIPKKRAKAIAVHELLHALHMEEDTRAKLTDAKKEVRPETTRDYFNLFEELKADMEMIATIPAHTPDPEDQNQMIIGTTASMLYYLQNGEAAEFFNFYYSSIAMFRAMIKAGIIQQDAGGNLSFVLDATTRSRFFQEAQQTSNALARVYHASPDSTQQMADQFMEEFCPEPSETGDDIGKTLFALKRRL